MVEDNLVNQRVLCKQLRNLGHIVHAANHGKEALAFLERSRFWTANDDTSEQVDVVLLDTEMPVMDGLTCSRLIRDAEGKGLVRGHVPIISVTANARSEQVEIARAAGMVRRLLPYRRMVRVSKTCIGRCDFKAVSGRRTGTKNGRTRTKVRLMTTVLGGWNLSFVLILALRMVVLCCLLYWHRDVEDGF